MLSTAGYASLWVALCFAVMQLILPLYGSKTKNPYFLAFARPCALGQLFSIGCAYFLLCVAFIQNDFSIAYVTSNSHANLPFMYRLAAVWGGHEGSILLWIVILDLWTIPLIFSSKANPNLPQILTILGGISVCFIAFLLFTSNPFLSNPQFLEGQDLNPLLQDIGFLIHPPMLYFGYVGFSIVFAITMSALLHKKLDDQWIVSARRFAIGAWCFLTLGITLGSWWAYRVLGWGGFWFWDPVENASLLPWLSGTAMIHVLLLADKRQVAQGWAALLSAITFILSILGTFLVRSGILISVHSFANDPSRGIFLLLILAIIIIAALVVYILRLPFISTTLNVYKFSWLSRESSLILNSAFLLTAMITVLLGTLYPLLMDAFNLGSISVGAPYFNIVMVPLLFITMIIMTLGPLCVWEDQSLKKLWALSWKKALISFISAFILMWVFDNPFDLLVFIGMSLSIWMLLSLINILHLSPAMTFAHSGFVIMVIGIILSNFLSMEKQIRIKPGGFAQLGAYQFVFVKANTIKGPNYQGIQAEFEVFKNDRLITHLYPEKRIYMVREMVMSKVDIHPSIFRDLYIALGEPLSKKHWSVRIYIKPFIRWIWFGGILMIIGGVFAVTSRSNKVFENKIKQEEKNAAPF